MVIKRILIVLVFLALGAYWGADITLDGIARDCQKQTFFKVAKVRFECMEWKPDVIYWDPTPTLPPNLPPR